LVNLTIAAISLNLWHDVVGGNVTRLYNVYRFEHRLNFFLPYGLCMLLTVPILTLGLFALRHNGVSAIDGGFLQVLMTAATGDTAIERAARPGCFGGKENIPEELEKLKVRFGELTATDGEITGETKSLSIEHETESRQSQDASREDSVRDPASASLLEARESVEVGEETEATSRITTASAVSLHQATSTVTRRAGFGTTEETILFRRGRDLSLT
jgi:hypothetical protein